MTLRARSISIALLTLLMSWLAFPSFFSEEARQASGWIPNVGVNLGLDLRGGIHWLLRINTATVERQELVTYRDRLADAAEERGLSAVGLSVEDDLTLSLGSDASGLQDLAAELFDQNLEPVEVDGEPRLRLSDSWRSEILRRGVQQSLEVLRRRIDTLGVTEPVIAPQGRERVLVQMPGEIDPGRARDILKDTTFLEFKLVVDAAQNEDLLLARYPSGLPEGRQVVVQTNDDGSVREAFLVPERPELTGAMLQDARLQFDRRNRPVVEFTWNGEGARLFREFTGEHIQERLAAIIDGAVVTAPVIQTRIGRRGTISGDFSQQEAADLAVKLRSGALPIPLDIEEERAVGPALGADSIANGVNSIALGGVLVVLFMGIYYRVAGLLADVALVLNLVFIIGAMGLGGATLTLPGIAGLVLTVGMAVDANVIIFERIREELRSGKSVRNAVQMGFRRSSLTILDANITTMIAAVVLLYFGRGPVQGFGVTLAVGIVSSVFCALVVTRLLVDLLLVRGSQALRI